MQPAHGALDGWGIQNRRDSPHVRPVTNRNGNERMFVRAVWRSKRLVDLKQTVRELDVPATRSAEIIGRCGPDFAKMTRGLFDR
jgi:hypothetical protein